MILLTAPPAVAATCSDLATLSLPGATIMTARSVPAGSFTPPSGPPIPTLPALCRIAGTIKPSGDSDIQFEVWLPASGWNGKLRGIGNGGFGGSIDFGSMGRAVARGYAAAATDTGHRGAGTDATWALGHPEKVVDFGYRAIHEMTDKAKAVVRSFYGEAPRRSYFHACSNGGRQALMEAQRFPEDYDGVVAGAPANFWTHLLAQAAWDMQATLADAAAYIPPTKLPAIEAAALAACDAIDGVGDGVIDDPVRCRFDPSALLCKAAESDACLTASHVGTLKKLYAGPRTSKGGQVHPGRVPGGAIGPQGWALWITGHAPGGSLLAAFGTSFFRNMVFEDPAWDYRTFEIERDTAATDTRLARILNATDPDLGRFRRRGGKLILYHGWSDPAISPLNTIDYYESVLGKMGAKEAETFLRLFMVPGMQHCSDGPGPHGFRGTSALRNDPEHDVDAAVERWVEEGVPPARIIAARYKTDSEPSSGVLRTRPLCPYPQVARWKGAGSTDEAANFVCTR